jgi:peptide/nickel transport system substrate-binding protein
MTFITSPAYNQVIVQAIQGDLARVGMKVKISTSDQATYLKKIQSPAHDWGDIRYGRWSCSCLDADGTLYPLFHAGTIWSSYSNHMVDQLLDAARTTTNKATRLKAYDEVLTILQKDAPAMGLYQDYAIYGASSHLQWRPDPQESFYVMQMRWT